MHISVSLQSLASTTVSSLMNDSLYSTLYRKIQRQQVCLKTQRFCHCYFGFVCSEIVWYFREGKGDRREGCDDNCWFPQVRRDFLMARERIEFRFVSVSVPDEGTGWWPPGLDLSLQVNAPRKQKNAATRHKHRAHTATMAAACDDVMCYLASLLSPTTFLSGMYPMWT